MWDGDFEFLGAPFRSSAFCAAHTLERVPQTAQTLKTIRGLTDPQVALGLLRVCGGFANWFSVPEFPPDAHTSDLLGFDEDVRRVFAEIIGHNPSANE